MNGHMKYDISMSPTNNRSKDIAHEVLGPFPLQANDFLEIEVLKKRSRRINGIPRSTTSIDLSENLIKENWISFLVLKLNSLARPGTSRRKLAGIIVWRMPSSWKNRILISISGRMPATSGIQTDIPAYSLDLGFALKTSDTPRVSIIIPAHNHLFTTLNCLRALQRNDDSTPYEVILVNDASTDLTAEAFRNLRGVKIVNVKKNVGYLRATNLGASYASSEYLVLLNNDTVPLSGWLDELVFMVDNDLSIAICGSTLLYPDGTLQESGSQIFKNGNVWNLGRGRDPFDHQFSFPREVDYASAASIIVRANFWKSVEGFDERYLPAYCEDADLALAAWSQGLRVVVSPNSWVVHYEGISHGRSTNSGLKKYQIENMSKLRMKWQEELSSHWEDAGIPRIEYFRESRGIVLLVDRQLPAGNRDSGSMRTIKIAQHIKELGFHVVLTALDSSTNEVEIENLRKNGIEVHNNLETAINSLASRNLRLKYAWLIRQEVFEYCAPKIMGINPKTKVIADLLDLDYKIQSQGFNINSKQLSAARAADHVILVSEVETEILQKALPNIDVLTIWYEFDVLDISPGWSKAEGLIFVGGFRHKPNVEGIRWFCNEVLPILKEDGFSGPVKIVGSGLDIETTNELTKSGAIVCGKQDDLLSLYQESRVAIVPLLSGRGKKGKLAEALAYGIPVVTTPVGAESFIFDQTDGVLIAESPQDFAEKILKVYENKEIWGSMHEYGFEYAKMHLSGKTIRKKISDTLR